MNDRFFCAECSRILSYQNDTCENCYKVTLVLSFEKLTMRQLVTVKSDMSLLDNLLTILEELEFEYEERLIGVWFAFPVFTHHREDLHYSTY